MVYAPTKERDLRPFLGICAIVKNEGPYIHEWLTYHRAIGVERFTLYDNGSTDDTLAEVARFGYPVDVIPWPGSAQQVPAYRDMLANRRHYTEWCAFIDVDEFLLPTDDLSVKDVLRFYDDMPEVSTVFVHWLFFGSSGAKHATPDPVTQRFTRRALEHFGPNRYGKSIVRMRYGAEVISPHLIGRPDCILTACGGIVDTTQAGKQERADHRYLALAHYFTKSEAEWTDRRARGRPALPADHPDAIRPMEQFRAHDRNDVEDLRVARVLAHIPHHHDWAVEDAEYA
jgi:glycosyltransferase involved in cell wall biosynthesis